MAVAIRHANHATPHLSAKVGTNFAYKRRSLGQYRSLADSGRVFFIELLILIAVCISNNKKKCRALPQI
jgi:hypothetical protein